MAKVLSLAVMAAAMLASAAAFPVEVEVRNSVWRNMVEPESGVEVPGSGSVKFSVRDADQLQRMLTNVDQINVAFQWPEGEGLSIHFGADADDGVTAAAQAAQVAAEAQAAQAAADAEAAAQAAQQAADAAAADEAAKAAEHAAESAAAAAMASQALADAAANGGTPPDTAPANNKGKAKA